MAYAYKPWHFINLARTRGQIDEMIKFLLPKGWFLKVTPGTKFATLGGCIASDVHGKEHHLEGCFSEILVELKLLVNKEKVIELSRSSHPDLFQATCGGMGLTGFIYMFSLDVCSFLFYLI